MCLWIPPAKEARFRKSVKHLFSGKSTHRLLWEICRLDLGRFLGDRRLCCLTSCAAEGVSVLRPQATRISTRSAQKIRNVMVRRCPAFPSGSNPEIICHPNSPSYIQMDLHGSQRQDDCKARPSRSHVVMSSSLDLGGGHHFDRNSVSTLMKALGYDCTLRRQFDRMRLPRTS